MIVTYILVLGTIASLRHYNFQTQTWDMGVFVQTLWNTTEGRPMFNNLEEVSNHLGVHMSPFLFLLVPGYMLFQSPYYLLIIQTIALALGAWPLYLLARKILGKWIISLPLAVSLGYLLYPSLHWINLFDFHAVSFLVPLLLASFYFLETKQWGWASLFLILAASTKEDAILIVMFIGIYYLIKKQWKVGLSIAVPALIYFIIATQVLMPALGGGLLRLDRYAHLGETQIEIIKNVVQNPSIIFNTVMQSVKFNYIFWIFLSVAFIPFAAISSMILLIPGFAENLLTQFEFQFTGSYQYDSVLVAGIFISTIFGLRALLTKWPHLTQRITWIFISVVLIGFVVRSPVNPVHFPTELFKSNPHWSTLREIVRMVPENATIAAHTNLVPHLSHREHAYMLGKEPFMVDIVLIDGADLFGFQDEKNKLAQPHCLVSRK